MKTDSVVAHGSTFLVTDLDGLPTRTHDGFYHRDTRHLDAYEFSTGTADVESLEIVTPRPGERKIHLGTPLDRGARDLHVRRHQVMTDGMYERVRVSNLTGKRLTETLTLSLGTAFDDIFEVRGHADAITREVDAVAIDDGARFEYAPDDIDFARATEVVVDEASGVSVSPGGQRAEATLTVDITLDPQESKTLNVAVTPKAAPADPAEAFASARTAVAARQREWRDAVTLPDLDDRARQAVVERSSEDLLSLTVDTEYGPLFGAGVPWFATVFGRDSLIAAYQVLGLTATPAKATLRYLADNQADTVDEYRGAEPGKIFHEIRRGELAAREEVPHTPYYGTVDATALFVVLLHATWEKTDDDALVEDLWGNLERALTWLDEHGDRDGDGFLEYPTDRGDGGGLTHQAWKDSGDGIVHPDGTHPKGPLAVAEVQGYYYDALRRAADLHREVVEDHDRAQELDERAADLQRTFDDAFWLPDAEFYAVALDGNGDRVPSVTTNPGHCLWSGIVPEDRADAVVDRLVSEDMFTGWGIRTLSSEHSAYNPQSYHLGSVWPHDNSLVVLGMANYGRDDDARTVARGLFDAAAERGTDRLPELFAGFDRDETGVPIEYGEACEPQAWAAAAPLACISALDDPLSVPRYTPTR